MIRVDLFFFLDRRLLGDLSNVDVRFHIGPCKMTSSKGNLVSGFYGIGV